MKLQFHGAARTVTGSQVLLSVNGSSVLLECGLYQGRREEAYARNKTFAFAPSTVDAVVLTHSHMDHSGNLPNLVSHGFGGPIHATPATVDLCKLMLRDSAYLQQRDIEWVNRIRARRHEPPLEPLYTIGEAEACMDSFAAGDYDTPIPIAPGITVTLREGGHILGSASILLEIEENGTLRRVGFTGDIGRPNMPIIQDPNLLRDLDVLIMESTYGNRQHAESDDIMETLAGLVTETAQAGGKVIIPAFAVGRTQLLVYLFHRLFNDGRIPDLPIFVDSPLALHATEVFRRHAELFDRETRRIFLEDKEDPFVFDRLKYTESVEDSKKLNGLTYPHVIISSSGMAEGGRILHHLRNNIGNHRNLVLFVGYAAKETLARKMMDGERKVKIFGEVHKVRCRVEKLDHFSAHADRGDLLKYAGMTPPERLKHIFLMHGELEQMEPLRHALRSQGYANVHMPERDEVFAL